MPHTHSLNGSKQDCELVLQLQTVSTQDSVNLGFLGENSILFR
jgi:hypothetical protein